MWFYPGRKQKEIGKKISSANGIANYLYYYRFFPLSFFTELRPSWLDLLTTILLLKK